MISRDNSRENILWVVDHLGYDGIMHGAGMYYLNTLPALNSDRFNAILCVLREKEQLLELFGEKGIDVRHLGRGKFDPLTVLDLLKLSKNESIALMHAHGYGSANFARVAGMIRGIPTIVHAHDDDRKYPFYQSVADRLLKYGTHKAIAVSESVRKSCVSNRHVDEEKTVVIHNGIPLKNFSSPPKEIVLAERERLGIGPGRKVIGTVAKLREEKGTRYLIESVVKVFAEFPDTILLIAGDGPLREELQALSRDLGIEDKVVFAGFREDIPVILSIIDVFVVPSLTEGSPLALLEAMAMEKPIVATNAGGIVEIMRDGETGLLVPSRDPDALAGKIAYLLGHDKESSIYALKAREEAEKYDIHSHARKLEHHYEALISSV